MKIVFLGSPEYAIPVLEYLIQMSDFEVLGVISQPAKKTGRGRKLLDPPLASYAKNNNLLVLQPQKASSPECINTLKNLV